MFGIAMILIWGAFWVISTVVNKVRSNKQFTHEVPSAIAGVVYYIFFLFIVWVVVASVFTAIPGFSFFTLIMIFFISPYLTSRITIYFSWVKTSFYLARLALIINGRSPFAGGLFAGYEAAKRIKNIEQQQQQLRWLRDKYLKIKSNRKLFSGEIIVFIFIDSALTHPKNNNYLVQRLKIVSCLPSASTPKQISLYAIKCSLANVLPSNNWVPVMKVIETWEYSPTRLTTFIEAFYERHILKEASVDLMPYFMKSLLALPYGSIKEWCHDNSDLAQANDHSVNSREDAIKLIWSSKLNDHSLEEDVKNNMFNVMTGLEQEDIWQTRAKELTINKNNIWGEIVSVVNNELMEERLTEEQQNFIDGRHQALHYIAQNIKQKWDSNAYKNSAEESVDWMQFFYTFNELEVIDKSEQLTAFSIHYDFLWDAMAGFWNNPNEYRLSYMIAYLCNPYAQECGFDELTNTINFILSK